MGRRRNRERENVRRIEKGERAAKERRKGRRKWKEKEIEKRREYYERRERDAQVPRDTGRGVKQVKIPRDFSPSFNHRPVRKLFLLSLSISFTIFLFPPDGNVNCK